PVEHARIELVRLAIDVDVAAREMGAHQWKAAPHHPGKEFIDKGILRTSQLRDLEPRRGQEGRRIHVPAMGGVEDERALPLPGLQDFERRLEFVGGIGHAGSVHPRGRVRKPTCTVAIIAVMLARSYPVYDLLRAALSMSCPSVPSR